MSAPATPTHQVTARLRVVLYADALEVAVCDDPAIWNAVLTLLRQAAAAEAAAAQQEATP